MSIVCRKGPQVVQKCGNDCPRRSVQSGHVVVECGVKPLSAVICLMNEMRCTSTAYNISQHIAMYTHFSDILGKYIKHSIPANLPRNVIGQVVPTFLDNA